MYIQVLRHVRLTAKKPCPGFPSWRRAKNRAIKAGSRAMGEEWVGEIGPAHFEPGAAARYHYRGRSKKYRQKKAAMVKKGKLPGPAEPLVYTGRSRDRVRMTRIAPTSRKLRLYIPTPTLNFKPGGHDLRGELLAVTNENQRAMNRSLRDGFVLDLNQQRVNDTLTVR